MLCASDFSLSSLKERLAGTYTTATICTSSDAYTRHAWIMWAQHASWTQDTATATYIQSCMDYFTGPGRWLILLFTYLGSVPYSYGTYPILHVSTSALRSQVLHD